MASVKMTWDEVMSKQITPEEEEELRLAAERPVTFDEDCPPMTPEQLMQFHPLYPNHGPKQTVSLRISPKTLRKAKLYGKGYTAFLSRLLDAAIEDENMVKKCL